WAGVDGDAELHPGETDGTTLGARVHVQFQWPTEGRFPVFQAIDSHHVTVLRFIQIIIVNAIVVVTQHHQVFRHRLPTMLHRFN
ncbi:hypothetical protein HMPREF0293_2726, partial [Corynebacterium glucuronolyticum ATCC 51866]